MAATNDPRLETNYGPETAPAVFRTKAALPHLTITAIANRTSQGATVVWAATGGSEPNASYRLLATRRDGGSDPPVGFDAGRSCRV